MNLPQEVITTLYTEGTAVALMIGLMVYTAGLKKKNGVGEHIFSILNIHVLLLALSGAMSKILSYQSFTGAYFLAKLTRNAYELFILAFLFYWMLFTDYLLYRSRDHLYRRYRMAFGIIVVFAAVLAANTFTGFLFDMSGDLRFDPKAGYWILVTFEYLYLINTALLLIEFYMKNKGPRFIKVLPFVIPFMTGSIISHVTPYEVRSLGIAVGLVLLHFSLMNERCYRDEKTGFYNMAFLNYIIGFATEHESTDTTGGCAILFDGGRNGDVLAEAIREEIPDNSAVVSMGKGNFLVLSRTRSNAGIKLFINSVKEDAIDKDVNVYAEHVLMEDGKSVKGALERLIGQEGQTGI